MATEPMRQIGSGDVNVVENKKYHWTVSNNTEARKEVPIIKITEYQQNVSTIRQAITYWSNQARLLRETGKAGDPYEALYSISNEEQGNTYTFPFYSTYHHAIQNAWGENKGTIGEIAGQFQQAITTGARALYPSAGIESAKSWEGSTPAEYQFSFQLLNTVSPKEDMEANTELIDTLINNNLLDKVDFLVVRPPAICEIEIPGIRRRTVGVMRTINIENLGQINRIDGDNIPDAYQLTITIQELLTESRQIYAGKLGNVFASVETKATSVTDVGTSVTELGESLTGAIRNATGI